MQDWQEKVYLKGLDLHSLLSFVLTISLVVIVHEFGHFAVAKFFKVSVEKFSVGFGRILFKKQFGITEFSIRIIPLGGFVKFYEKSKFKNLTLFEKIPLYKRSLIVFAGPLINFIFAFFLLIFLNQGEQFKILPKITALSPESVASNVGFKVDDLILSINDKRINSVNEHNRTIIELADQDLKYKILRKNQTTLITLPKSERLDLKMNRNNNNNINGLNFFPSAENSLVIDNIVLNSPAEKAGIMKNDRIISVNDKKVFNINDFVSYIKSKPNEKILILVARENKQIEVSITPQTSGNIVNKGVIGVKIRPILDNKKDYIKSFKYNNLELIYKSFYDVLSNIKMVFKSFVHILTGNIDWRMLSGPISIAELSSETISMGLLTYLSFLVFLNINVGLLNLLPIPTLDGGQLFFYSVEAIFGRPLNNQKMIISQRLGVIILFLVFTLAVYNDVFNFMLNK